MIFFANKSCLKWGSLEAEEIVIKAPLGSSSFLSDVFNSNPGKVTECLIPIFNTTSPMGCVCVCNSHIFFFYRLLACVYTIIVANVGIWHFNNILLHFKENTPFCTILAGCRAPL